MAMRPLALTNALTAIVLLLGCETPQSSQSAAAGCGKDTDCKGDRICEMGRCVAPPMAMSSVQPSVTTVATGDGTVKVRISTDPDGASVSEDGVELCSTPCTLLYKGIDAESTTQHALVFARSGYRTESRTIRAGDSPINVRLVASR